MTTPKIGGTAPSRVWLDAGERAWWCRCGRSRTQPWCDGSHLGTGIEPVEIVADERRLYVLCLCKRTGRVPFCDGSHKSLTRDDWDRQRGMRPCWHALPCRPREGELVVGSSCGIDVALLRIRSELRAYLDRCPACEGRLIAGPLEETPGGTPFLRCDRLGHTYDARTGRRLQPEGPALDGLPIEERDGDAKLRTVQPLADAEFLPRRILRAVMLTGLGAIFSAPSEGAAAAGSILGVPHVAFSRGAAAGWAAVGFSRFSDRLPLCSLSSEACALDVAAPARYALHTRRALLVLAQGPPPVLDVPEGRAIRYVVLSKDDGAWVDAVRAVARLRVQPAVVWLDMPPDSARHVCGVPAAPRVPRCFRAARSPDSEGVADLTRRLFAAAKPLLVVGGGARHAGRAIRDLARHLGAPVVTTLAAKGALAESVEGGSWGVVGPGGSRRALAALDQADLLVALGVEPELLDLLARRGSVVQIEDRPWLLDASPMVAATLEAPYDEVCHGLVGALAARAVWGLDGVRPAGAAHPPAEGLARLLATLGGVLPSNVMIGPSRPGLAEAVGRHLQLRAGWVVPPPGASPGAAVAHLLGAWWAVARTGESPPHCIFLCDWDELVSGLEESGMLRRRDLPFIALAVTERGDSEAGPIDALLDAHGWTRRVWKGDADPAALWAHLCQLPRPLVVDASPLLTRPASPPNPPP